MSGLHIFDSLHMADLANSLAHPQGNGVAPSAGQDNQGGAGSFAAPPSFDINSLAAFVQQFQKQQAKQQHNGSTNSPPGLQDAVDSAAKAAENSQQDGSAFGNATDSQGLMEQIASLTKNLEQEKTKSKVLQVPYRVHLALVEPRISHLLNSEHIPEP